MRRFYGWPGGAVVAALALVSCAAEGDHNSGPTLPPATVEDGGAPSVSADVQDATTDAQPDADAYTPECSSVGWCTTHISWDTVFTFTDIWPFAKTAFATAFPTGRPIGGTIAEYDGEQWQLLTALSNARVVWAPSEDEVWAGGDSSVQSAPLKRGIRSSGTWTWTDMLLAEKHILGIWGAGSNDVYVLAVNDWSGDPNDCSNCIQHVYHIDAEGASSLVLEGTARFGPWARQSPDGPTGLWIDGITGTSPNDVWIVGHRGWCAYLAHKSDATFETLADAIPGSWPAIASDGSIASACTTVGDAFVWKDWFFSDWVHVATAGAEELAISIRADFGVTNAGIVVTNRRVYRVKLMSEKRVQITAGAKFGQLDLISSQANGAPYKLQPYQLHNPTAIWSPTSGDLYVAGFGTILRSLATFEDAGTFSYSSVALHGAFLDRQLYAIRGTAANNVWVVGDSYALHKTTP